MTTFEATIISATFLGPILAVQAQKWVERYNETRNRKLSVFVSLMTTRAQKVSQDHVRALNSIDLVFKDDRMVIDRWREYYDALSPTNPTTEDKFIELLFAMSASLKFGFDKVMLRRVFYIPQAHVDLENQQQENLKNLGLMLKGQQEIQKGMIDYLNGTKALRVTIDGHNA